MAATVRDRPTCFEDKPGMLAEILLGLSGIPTPIWQQFEDKQSTTDNQHNSSIQISAAERSLLRILEELSRLHIGLKKATATISQSHPSTICRGIGSRVAQQHLRAFTEKIIEVEKAILSEDAAYVGAYKSVPLSTLVTQFEPWTRRLKWLRTTMNALQELKNGPAALQYLEKETYTGFRDIKEISLDLLVFGQRAWTQCLLPWLLYGCLSATAPRDFMVKQSSGEDGPVYQLDSTAVPYFVAKEASQMILDVGRTVIQIKSQRSIGIPMSTTGQIGDDLLKQALTTVQALSYPLLQSDLSKAMSAIYERVSEVVLVQLLPVSAIYRFLLVAHEFLFLNNGSFATSLVEHSQARLNPTHSTKTLLQPIHKLGRTPDLTHKDSDLEIIMDRTWTDAIQASELDDRILTHARELLRLKLLPADQSQIPPFLPVYAGLTVDVQSKSTLKLFLTTHNIQQYQSISSYLFSLRKAQFQLSHLWKLTNHRRQRTTSLHSARTAYARSISRLTKLRPDWACVSQIHFFLSELIFYLYSEVVRPAWSHFDTWLAVDHDDFSRSSGKTASTPRPSTANSHSSRARNMNPRLLARAHSRYLTALSNSLLFSEGNKDYLYNLKSLLTGIEHYVALFSRLTAIWSALDLHTSRDSKPTIKNVLLDYAQDEQDTLLEMERTRTSMLAILTSIVEQIRMIETNRGSDQQNANELAHLSLGANGQEEFRPRQGRTLDRLLMKLDSLDRERDNQVGQVESDEDHFEDALVG